MLTPYEAKRLAQLASKAGISVELPKTVRIRLKKREIGRLERGLEKAFPSPIVVSRKRGTIRVYSREGHAKLCAVLKKNRERKSV